MISRDNILRPIIDLKRSTALKVFPLIPDKVLRLYFPRTITIEPIAGCNLACVACPVSDLQRPKGKMKLEHFKKIVSDVGRNVRDLELYFMGEPLLHPKIFDMVEFAKRRNLTVHISTNGTTLKKHYKSILDSGVDKLIVCLDGFSQESLEKYRRGAKFEDIIEGISKLASYRREICSNTEIIIKTLIFEHNENELEMIKKFAKSVGVDHFVIVKPIIEGWGGKRSLAGIRPSSKKEFSRPKVNPKPPCPWVLHPIVTWEGDLIPCCFDVHAKHKFGNVIEKDFEEVYWSPKARKIRLNILKMKLEICQHCLRVDDEDRIIRIF